MKAFNKSLFVGLVSLVCCASVFAECPLINAHRLTSHDQNDRNCTYTSNKVVFGARQNPKLCEKEFILTDPHYRMGRCKVSSQNNHCVCTIVKR